MPNPHIPIEDLTPRQIVAELDKYIVGQDRAKRAVAVAMRNRFRRARLPEDQREEILPKNILMMGPTGVGKTEIARRLAKLAKAPFLKVEATKFTEVGYVGRDVDSMIRDLTNIAVRLVESERTAEVAEAARERALDRIADLLMGEDREDSRPMGRPHPLFTQAMEMLGTLRPEGATVEQPAQHDEPEPSDRRARAKATIIQQIREGARDDDLVEVELEEPSSPFIQVFSAQGMEEMGVDVANPFSAFGGRRSSQRMTVKEALPILTEEEARKMVDQAAVTKEAVARVEQTGIIFLDELDKVTGASGGSGPDVSREGVQRDLLPLIEGTTVVTKYGPVKTDFVLFIAAGAFHVAKPSDLIPELQGRLPIRVELSPLNEQDFLRILTEPQNSLVRQYAQLLGTEGITLNFEPEAIQEIARIATDINARTENIGARRLHTVMERVLEPYLFDAPEIDPPVVTVTADLVRERLADIAGDTDLCRYIL
ncbi:MAG: ATP-dependent protease ATPase subunit HslU [Fimbriimonadales bacterium]